MRGSGHYFQGDNSRDKKFGIWAAILIFLVWLISPYTFSFLAVWTWGEFNRIAEYPIRSVLLFFNHGVVIISFLAALVGGAVAFGFSYLLAGKQLFRIEDEGFGLKFRITFPVVFFIFLGFAAGLAINYLSFEYAPNKIRELESMGRGEAFLASGWPLVMNVIRIVILASLFEEMVFRGAMLQGIRSKLGNFVAVGLVSVVFSLAHCFSLKVDGDSEFFIAGYFGNFWFHFLFSVALCKMRLSSGDLMAGIGFHAAYNLAVILSWRLWWHDIALPS